MNQEEARRTPLYEEHLRAGARMVPFAGFDMPVQYGGVVEEHQAVRLAAGLFDVSHMGEFEIEGPDALANVERLTPNHVGALAPGQAHYSALLTERGTFVDDVLVYRRAERRFLIVVNAANIAKDFAWVKAHLAGDVAAVDASDRYGLLAIQGPKAVDIVASIASADVRALPGFSFQEDVALAGIRTIVSRTGYTGEDGFEIFVRPEDAAALWRALLAAGEGSGLKPAGLGARDTLRLEARLPLYGNDIDDEHTPLEAGFGFIVKLAKGDFLGREVLERQQRDGVARKLVGFSMTGREIARHGYPVFVGDTPTGSVTSGSFAPFLKANIGLTYLPAGHGGLGTEIAIAIRDRRAPARVVKTPFYKRPKS